MDPTVKREIEDAVREEKERYGVPGTVVLVDRSLELHAGGPPVSIDLDVLVEQWPVLPLEMRERKAAEAARRLVDAYRSTSGARPRGRLGPPKVFAVPLGAALLAAVTVGVVLWFLVSGGLSPAKAPDAGAGAETEEQAKARWARVCEATRRRLYSGNSIGPFDAEGYLNGWVAELWLARSKGALKDDPTFNGMIQDGKLTRSADELLAGLNDATVELADGLSAVDAKKSPSWGTRTVRFRGKYVSSLFDPENRPRLLAVVDRLADAAGAELGALYGRCAHLTTHDLGAWFRGPSAGGAATAMVYGMGFFAEVPTVDRGSLSALGELDSLRAASAHLDESTLAGLVGASGGGLTTSTTTVAITFPVAGMTRATSATRSVARKLGVGVGSD